MSTSAAATEALRSAAGSARAVPGAALAAYLLDMAASLAEHGHFPAEWQTPWDESVGYEAMATAVSLAESLADESLLSPPAASASGSSLGPPLPGAGSTPGAAASRGLPARPGSEISGRTEYVGRESARAAAWAAVRAAVVAASRQIDTRRAAAEDARRAEAASAAAEHANYLTFLSHDLRGGLNGILLMIEVLKRDLDPPSLHPPVDASQSLGLAPSDVSSQLEDLDVMRRGVLDTVSLMDRFIYAERFRRGLVKVRRDRVDLGSIGEQLRTQFAEPARERGLQLVVSAAGTVTTDRALLSLIATNLVANAAQHASPGILRLSLSTAPPVPTPADPTLPPTDRWRLEVSDPGPGIPPAILASVLSSPTPPNATTPSGTASSVFPPRVPHPPGPAHPPRPPHALGGGVGLKLAKVSAEALGARLDIRSTPAGTTIVVERG